MLARYAVIGAPIAHSLSPGLHQQFARERGIPLTYERILLDEGGFEAQIKAFFAAGGAGLNITAPGKTRAFDLAEIKTERCFKAGAANTLWMDEKKRLCADNTDGIGLINDLKRRVSLSGAHILILGAGGAVRGILPDLLSEGPSEVVIDNRTEARAKALVEHIGSKKVKYRKRTDRLGIYDLVVHATGRVFTGLEGLEGAPFCYDLTYDRSGITPFVQWARRQGYPAIDGFGMLVGQAAEAFFVWHGVRP
ncbi:MAG: shikimate dehydrogenase [Gammaproteobacteria bacterium]|nr:shikimate dehydrogenase [Gammaproteobacteria bacterium]